MIQDVLTGIQNACHQSGRDPQSVKFIAVTKSHTITEIRDQVTNLGHLVLGENRIQEALPKIEAFPNAQWHLIGHLQTNKVRFCQNFHTIHSLDSIKLALEIAKRAESWGRAPNLLIEVNVARETQKYGVLPEDTKSLLNATRSLGLNVNGLMTIAPFDNLQKSREVFQELRQMRDSLDLEQLSMGMSEDYEIAIEAGATMIRVGRATFMPSAGVKT